MSWRGSRAHLVRIGLRQDVLDGLVNYNFERKLSVVGGLDQSSSRHGSTFELVDVQHLRLAGKIMRCTTGVKRV